MAKPDDTLMVMCRSGGRSAMAANALAKAGFKKVYNIIDGMEGDANADSESVAKAQPLKDRLEELRLSVDKETHARADGASEGVAATAAANGQTRHGERCD